MLKFQNSSKHSESEVSKKVPKGLKAIIGGQGGRGRGGHPLGRGGLGRGRGKIISTTIPSQSYRHVFISNKNS